MMNVLIRQLARWLNKNDRDAVLGDLLECEATNFKIGIGLIGLIARQQAMRWKDWRPWLTLTLLVGLAGPALWEISLLSSRQLIREAFTYHAVGVFFQSGTNTVIAEFMGPALGIPLLLAGSWACAFVLAASARRTAPLTIFLYLLVWMIPPPMMLFMWHHFDGVDGGGFRLFELELEVAFHAVLFILPSILGWQYGLGRISKFRHSLNF